MNPRKQKGKSGAMNSEAGGGAPAFWANACFIGIRRFLSGLPTAFEPGRAALLRRPNIKAGMPWTPRWVGERNGSQQNGCKTNL
jgi:hypothetical protein